MKHSEVRPEKSILDALPRAGVRAYAADPSEPSGQGVLFFDQITQRLCHFLSEASRRWLERILAVALSHSALAERGAWPNKRELVVSDCTTIVPELSGSER